MDETLHEAGDVCDDPSQECPHLHDRLVATYFDRVHVNDEENTEKDENDDDENFESNAR